LKQLFCAISLLFSVAHYAQTNYYIIDTTGINISQLDDNDKELLDSILPLANNATHDSILIKYIGFLAESCWDETLWPRYNQMLIEIADRNLSKEYNKTFVSYKASAISNVGFLFDSQGKSVLAIENYKASLKLFDQIGDRDEMSSPLNNLGKAYHSIGDVEKALSYWLQALQIREELGQEEKTIVVNNNIATVYQEQNEDSISEVYYRKALNSSLKFNNKHIQALTHNQIGKLFFRKQEYDSAHVYYNISYQLRKEIGFKQGMAESLQSIGQLFNATDNEEKAFSAYDLSLQILEGTTHTEGIIGSKIGLATIYLKKGEAHKAMILSESAFKAAQKIGFPSLIKSTSELLTDVYTNVGMFEKALSMNQLNILMRDSLVNLDNQKSIYKQQVDFNFEKKEQELIIEEEKRKIVAQQEEEKKNMIIMFISIGLIILIGFTLFLYNRFRLIKKQKAQIEEQKTLVDEQKSALVNINGELSSKNNMITDSIYYAKKIQKAILPDQESFHKYFQDIFVLYQPKDIVSGDFYWGYKTEKEILFTVADCTGHGVPGAFMSLIGSNILDKIVGEMKITRPDLILEQLSKEIYTRLQAENDSEVKDGMDLVMCSVNLETKKLQLAGAYNPMYIVRDKKIIQFKTDRYQLGNPDHIENKNITLQTFDLKTNDIIYLFSDGFPDQKGGEKGKKYFYPPFRDLLLKNSELSLTDQKRNFNEELEVWKGGKEQIDDILIMGLKI
jgi:serine phosphatase RsbU (regulator of sigma subunit)